MMFFFQRDRQKLSQSAAKHTTLTIFNKKKNTIRINYLQFLSNINFLIKKRRIELDYYFFKKYNFFLFYYI